MWVGGLVCFQDTVPPGRTSIHYDWLYFGVYKLLIIITQHVKIFNLTFRVFITVYWLLHSSAFILFWEKPLSLFQETFKLFYPMFFFFCNAYAFFIHHSLRGIIISRDTQTMFHLMSSFNGMPVCIIHQEAGFLLQFVLDLDIKLCYKQWITFYCQTECLCFAYVLKNGASLRLHFLDWVQNYFCL